MKQYIKKIFYILFGTQKNLTFKIGLSSFTSSFIFFFLSNQFQESYAVYNICKFASAVFIALFLLAVIRSAAATNFFIEAIRFVTLFGCFCLSFRYLAKNILSYSGFPLYFYSFLSCISIFAYSFYIISKFNDIFEFFKSVFTKFKSKLFNSTDPPISKITELLTNITAFLAAISALAIAVQTIAEMTKTTFDSFK